MMTRRPRGAGGRSSRALGTGAGFALTGPFAALGARAAGAAPARVTGSGLAARVKDQTTGLELLKLPRGFEYVSFGWRNDVMSDGTPTPGSHDGMAAFRDGDLVRLVRNHEQGNGTPFAPAGATYDPLAAGGTTTLMFDPERLARRGLRQPERHDPQLRGRATGGHLADVRGDHGGQRHHPARLRLRGPRPAWRIPCPSRAWDGSPTRPPPPIRPPGSSTRPRTPAPPSTATCPRTRRTSPAVASWRPWSSTARPTPGSGPAARARRRAGSSSTPPTGRPASRPPGSRPRPRVPAHRPGEGAWYGNGVIYVISTSGGAAGQGQVLAYDPAATFTCVFASSEVLNAPDNVCVSPGAASSCARTAAVAVPARHDARRRDLPLRREQHRAATGVPGHQGVRRRLQRVGVGQGHLRAQERQLAVRQRQSPGVTFAITGPWRQGAL